MTVGYHTQGLVAAVADQHVVLAQRGDDRPGLADPFPVHLKDDDVGLDAVGVHGQAIYVGQAGGQAAGVGVVVGQPFHHRVQGDQAGGGQHAGLPHSAAHHLAPPAGAGDELLGAAKHGTHGAGKGFGEAEADVVHIFGQLGGGHFQGHGGVENTGAVQMNGGAGGVGHINDGFGVLGRHYAAAATVVGIFQADQGGCGYMDVGAVADGVGHILGGDASAGVVRHQPDLGAGEGSGAGRFVPEHMGFLAHNHFVAPAAPGQGGDEVTHGAAGGEQAGFLAHQGGGAFLQGVDGGILAEHVVADFGGGHSAAHFVSGLGNGVATQVNRSHKASGGLCRHARRWQRLVAILAL